jgi:AcrR family transcriptional regulator
MHTGLELPLMSPEGAPRADAARNRERILAAASRLFEQRGAGCVSMDDVADAAGVGKGTLFRRFGSRALLAAAVLSEHERALQETIIRGDPPLGPGAPPQERLVAFGEAWLDLLSVHAELIAAADSTSARFDSPPYAARRLHMRLLLEAADPECDAELVAELLLESLRADWFIYMREVRGVSLERLKTGWRELVGRTLAPAAAPADAGPAATAAG